MELSLLDMRTGMASELPANPKQATAIWITHEWSQTHFYQPRAARLGSGKWVFLLVF